MSSSYSLEPPTHGKVLLKTTYGDLDIELWPNQAPLACRNFCQLAMEGYYDNSTFHRVIRNFMFQGGDPSGAGVLNPEDTIYGSLFKDEFHSRLKFNHRGLVGCANDNRADSNGSGFFITLDRADHLNKKATIFGRVCGDTLHNLSRFNEVDTDGDDRPEFPIYVTEAKVLVPPFEDLAPRATGGERKVEASAKVVKSKVKNAALMSFDDEDFEDEGFAVKKVHVVRPSPPVQEVRGGAERVEKEGNRLREDDVLLDYGEDADLDQDGVGRSGAAATVTAAAEAPLAVAGADARAGAGARKRVSLVEASREKYVSRQKKYASKRKKESDVLMRIKQFKHGNKARNLVMAGGKEDEVEEDGTRDGKSILRQLDEILQG